MEEAIRSRLLATSGVTSLVGSRVYWGSRPQGGTLPDIIIRNISGAPIYTDDGESGLAEARLEIDCYGETFGNAKSVARAVIVSLSAFFGQVGGVTFQYILLDSERDFRDAGINADEYLFRTNMDFIVWYEN